MFSAIIEWNMLRQYTGLTHLNTCIEISHTILKSTILFSNYFPSCVPSRSFSKSSFSTLALSLACSYPLWLHTLFANQTGCLRPLLSDQLIIPSLNYNVKIMTLKSDLKTLSSWKRAHTWEHEPMFHLKHPCKHYAVWVLYCSRGQGMSGERALIALCIVRYKKSSLGLLGQDC